ncbi:hypothetical protein A6E13_16390 [Aliivibrio fischeri]|uniref:hypothetical protein n=1 Tax=Aliivibrio fischeri TaxID=668 RepID=UPI00080E555B|nr:hypothetical protein [Aliivibrio fischeri]OCH31801.1 hypothetical protein A6E13_16390 [Aliivibrio fischeri]
MNWSLPKTCFSCQHYQQEGYKHDELAPTINKYGFSCEPKQQRYGSCDKKQCHVFWNESTCPSYTQELGINTHECQSRPKAMQPHQDNLF